MVVLVRVVTLGSPQDGRRADGPTEASAPLAEVAVLDAAGRRSGPVVVETAGAATILVPKGHAGHRGAMTVWRRTGGDRDTTPWLELRPRVRADDTLSFAGLPAGRYDFELRFDDATMLGCTDAAVPGEVRLRVTSGETTHR